MFRVESQTRFWLFILAAFIFAFWLLKPVLLPFIAGLAVAYFLTPVVDKLAHKNIPRWVSALAVLLGFGIAMALIILLILPMLKDQIGALIRTIPDLVEKTRWHFIPWAESLLTQFSPDDAQKIHDAVTQSVGTMAGFIGQAFQHIISGGLALIDILALLVITPIVSFYLLRDWPQLTSTIDSLLPRRQYDVIWAELNEVNHTLSGFVRGQALVCLALAVIYSGGLSAAGLQYGLVIGIIAGILTFIPYVGTTFAWVSSLILSLIQFDDWTHIGMVAGVLVFGHVMEAYVLTPRLVGHRVGLHPVWILFALISGAKLMGFLGVLIAVPVAAVIGVLIRFAVRQYKKSAVYKDPLAPNRP